MKVSNILPIITLLGILSGCGTTGDASSLQHAQLYMKTGNCQAAIDEIIANSGNPGQRATNLGSVYHGCVHDDKKAIQYFTLGARYGFPPAPENLIRLGAPVPTADLARQSVANDASSLDALAIALHSYNESNEKARQNNNNKTFINCTSTKVGNSVDTSCY